MTAERRHVPVVIAGGGPVGLTLAALLSRFGVATLVVEADAGYCTGSRAICIARRSLEILGWCGAARAVVDIGLPWVGGRSYFRDAEVLHFTMPTAPGERFPPMVNVQQYHVEEAAHRRLEDGVADVAWNTRVDGVRTTNDGVEVDVVAGSGARATVAADWLVACDGGRSTVRERLGLTLEGIEYEGRYVIVDIEQETARDVERLAWFDPPSNPGSTILMHRQPGNVWRVDYQIRDDEDPVAAVRPENVLPRVASHLAMIGEDAPWKPLWISIYNAKCLTLARYRHGRVLFAGDAAHLVPIFGVRGLNSGLDDAGNLAWKLALVVHGDAHEALLDTYSEERVHAARENIAYGAKSTEFMAPPGFGYRLMREAALRLAVDDANVRSLINPRQSAPVAYRAPEPSLDHLAAPGMPAPDACVASHDARHLSELFGHGFVVLVFGNASSAAWHDVRVGAQMAPRGVAVYRVVREHASPTDGDLVDLAGEAFVRYGATDGTTILIRPDGYILARWPAAQPSAVRATIDRYLSGTVVQP